MINNSIMWKLFCITSFLKFLNMQMEYYIIKYAHICIYFQKLKVFTECVLDFSFFIIHKSENTVNSQRGKQVDHIFKSRMSVWSPAGGRESFRCSAPRTAADLQHMTEIYHHTQTHSQSVQMSSCSHRHHITLLMLNYWPSVTHYINQQIINQFIWKGCVENRL